MCSTLAIPHAGQVVVFNFFNRHGRKGKFNDFFSAMNARKRSETLALLAVFSKSEAFLCVQLWLSRMRDKLRFLIFFDRHGRKGKNAKFGDAAIIGCLCGLEYIFGSN